MEESDEETADSVWVGYECKSGEILFYYNQKTGEHRWAKDLYCSESNVIKVSVSDLSGKHPSDVHSVGTQTEDYGCTNGCSSIYIHAEDYTVTGNREWDESMCSVYRTSNICGVSVDDGHHLETSEMIIPKSEIEDNGIDEEYDGVCVKLGNDEVSILTDSCQSTGLLPDHPIKNEANCKEECDDKIQDSNCDFILIDSCQSTGLLPDHPIKNEANCNEECDGEIQDSNCDSLMTEDLPKLIKDIKSIGNRNGRFGNALGLKMGTHTIRLEDISFGPNILDENGKKASRFRICLENEFSLGFCKKSRSESKISEESMEMHSSCEHLEYSPECIEDYSHERGDSNSDSIMTNSSELVVVCDAFKDVHTPHDSNSYNSLNTTHCVEEYDSERQDLNSCNSPVTVHVQSTEDVKSEFAHIKTHNSNKSCKCLYCDKAFTHKHNLTTHIQTHTSEKPYKCNRCEKAYKGIHALRYHLRTHTGEKPFKCSHCDKAFVQRSDLNVHLRKHTGEKTFKCLICGNYFSQANSLATHRKIHAGIKPYRCSHCGKAFARKAHLILHLGTHTGEKPFKCSHCDKTFRSKYRLADHLQKHSPGKQS